jgi:hypothetical protein
MQGSLAGTVVVYLAQGSGYRHRHERETRAGIAQRLAALKGFAFGGDYEPGVSYNGPLYFAPGDTLVGCDAAAALGIACEHDLFGGVVPYAFAATKIISHPLVAPDAVAPVGWSHAFAERVGDAVLSGFSVFSREDARVASWRLLEHGPARVKPVRETGGRGQTVVGTHADLDEVLAALDETELKRDGLVIEENLTEVTTYSVGLVRVADLVATYHGTQTLTPANDGMQVYGGSRLDVVRGDFEALLALDLDNHTRLAVTQARTYDAAASALFPGLVASRRNYDIARGRDARGEWRCGVLEQSWRIGGASGAEIGALEAFRADPSLAHVRAATVEIYGADAPPPPPGATVYFRGTDKHVGPLTKYAVVERHADPR